MKIREFSTNELHKENDAQIVNQQIFNNWNDLKQIQGLRNIISEILIVIFLKT